MNYAPFSPVLVFNMPDAEGLFQRALRMKICVMQVRIAQRTVLRVGQHNSAD